MLRRRTIVAWVVLVCILASFRIVPWLMSLVTEAKSPLSIAIVTALERSPRGGTDVSETLCPLATQAAVAIAARELAWSYAGRSRVTTDAVGPGPIKGSTASSFEKSNGFLEGNQTLWLNVNDSEHYCTAHIQTYSW